MKILIARLVALAALGLVACSSTDDDAPNNGVDDVRAACVIRTTWTNLTSDRCINCRASAPSATCECEAFRDYAGLCHTQDAARQAEPSCTTAIKDCAHACPATDCACLEACYAPVEACKSVVAATDGCVTDVCAQYCR